MGLMSTFVGEAQVKYVKYSQWARGASPKKLSGGDGPGRRKKK